MLQIKSTSRAIAYSMLMSISAKILTLLQSQVISYSFGMQRSTDILFSVLTMIVLITSFINTVNQSVMVPSIINIRQNVSEEESKKFINYIYLNYFAISIIAVSVLFLFNTHVFRLALRFEPADLLANLDIIRLIIPVFLLIVINQFILDIFTSYRFFTMPMFFDMSKNIVIILFVLAFKDALSVKSLAAGVLIGNLTQFVILNILLVFRLKIRFAFKRFKIEALIKKNILYVVTGQTARLIKDYYVIYLLTGFTAGVYSAMDYGQKLNTVLASVLIGQTATVTGLNIIGLYVKKDFVNLNRIFRKYVRTGLYILFPLCFIMFINANTIISVMFGWGKMTLRDVELTAGFFMYFIPGLPAVFIDAMVVRLIIAKQIQRISFMWSIFSNIMTMFFVFIALKYIGYYGYPTGVLLSSSIYAVLLLLFLVKPQFRFIDTSAILRFLVLSLLVNSSLMMLIKLLLASMSMGEALAGKLILLLLSTLLYIAGYIAASLAIRDLRTVMTEIFGYIKSTLSHGKKAAPEKDSLPGRKRICFMLHRTYPLFNPDCKGVFGGAEVNLYFLACHFAKNPAFSVVYYVGEYGQRDVEKYYNIEVRKLRYTDSDKFGSLYHKALRYACLVKELLFSKCDIYITSTADELLGFMAFFVGKIRKKPVVFRLSSDSNADMSLIRQKSKRTRVLYKYGLLNSDRIVCQTNYQQALLQHNFNLNSVVIKNGFPLKADIDITNKKYILWVSRAVAMKRPELFLELAKRLPDENFIIIIPGSNSISSDIYEECRKLTNIRFIDYVPFQDTQSYFEEAKLFINTSEFEGFPNTFIQACLAKTPVLSFRVDPDQFLSKNNIGFCCDDSLDSAVRFIRELNEDKIAFYGENGFNYVSQNHDLNKTAAKYEELFSQFAALREPDGN